MTFKIKRFFNHIVLFVATVFFVASCNTVKNYPANKPFIFENKIIIHGDVSKDKKKQLTTELNNYWDDSAKAVRLQKFGVKSVINNPPVYDSINILRSKKFMNAYLNSQGYYYSVLKDTVVIKQEGKDTVNKQLRTTVTVTIDLGKNITIDSINYNLHDSNMQRMAQNEMKNSLLKKGGPYSKEIISKELDRLTHIYRDSGYFKFTRDNILAEVDSNNAKLLPLTVDPFEQAKLLAEAAKSREEDPKWDVIIKQRPIKDSATIRQFYIGKIYYYPQTAAYESKDSLMRMSSEQWIQKGYRDDTTKGGAIVRHKQEKRFNYKPLREHTFIRRDSLYSESMLIKSINSLNRISTWKQVEVRDSIRNKDSLDVFLFLTPDKKYNFGVDLQGSNNTGDIISGSLLSLGLTFTLRDRNFLNRAILSTTSTRFGADLNVGKQRVDTLPKLPLIQTLQASFAQTFSIPRLILPQWRWLRKFDNKYTNLKFSAAYEERRDYYKQSNAAIGWTYTATLKNHAFAIGPNIELYRVDTLALLDSLIKANPFLQNSFRNGNVIGLNGSWNTTFISKNNPNINHYLRGFLEFSYWPTKFLGTNVFRYVKVEAEWRHLHKFSKSEIATRVISSIALHSKKETVPAFKQYFEGGSSSMRAWSLRQLGLGSSIVIDTNRSNYSDRFGDWAMEFNGEYRFTLFNFNSFKIGSAVFADMGNVWNLYRDPTNPNAEISISRFYRDLALGMGTGLRFDFNYFLIRLDLGYKVKDPARQYNNGWMSFKDFVWTDTRINGVKISNIVLQFGIGLPF
jgi:hypothetical protein